MKKPRQNNEDPTHEEVYPEERGFIPIGDLCTLNHRLRRGNLLVEHQVVSLRPAITDDDGGNEDEQEGREDGNGLKTCQVEKLSHVFPKLSLEDKRWTYHAPVTLAEHHREVVQCHDSTCIDIRYPTGENKENNSQEDRQEILQSDASTFLDDSPYGD